VLIARLVVHLFQGVFVAVANWDMGMEKGTLTKPNVRLSYAVLGIGNLRLVLIVLITPIAMLYKDFMIKLV